MQHLFTAAAIAFSISLAASQPSYAKSNLSDNDIRDRMIDESIRGYSGSCPCPYNLASNGSRCGRRSAYTKPGGAAPLCYREDINDEMVKAWRRRKGL